jgi:hypothetical protein
MASITKSYPIPDWEKEQLDILKNWDKYLGSIWANIILKSDIPLDGTILEIAPGTAEKIGRGLQAIGFKGKLYVVEPEAHSLNEITSKYRQHIPGCSVIPVCKTLQECLSQLPRNIDAVIANHPLDDMILGNSLDNNLFKAYFGEKFGTDIERTKSLWNRLEENQAFLQNIKQDIITSWQNIINYVRPKMLGISQYESYYFQKNNILAPDRNALDILERISKIYAKYEDKAIMNSIKAHNADLKHWKVFCFNKNF